MLFHKIGLFLTRLIHLIIVFCSVASIPHILAIAKWWIALPLAVLILNLVWTGGITPLTDLENSFRKKLKLKKIKCFISCNIARIISSK